MSIEINEKSYIVGFWFSWCPRTNNNWLACAIKDPDNPKKYKAWFRFRYIKDDKIWGGEDKKNWFTFTLQENQTDDDVINIMTLAQKEIEAGYPEKDNVIVKGDIHKMMKLTEDKEWMHIKTEKVKL